MTFPAISEPPLRGDHAMPVPAQGRSASRLAEDLLRMAGDAVSLAAERRVVFMGLHPDDYTAAKRLKAMTDFMRSAADVRQRFEAWRAGE